MSNPTATTELEAVNIMLRCIGEAPVNTLNDAAIVDVGMAQNMLAEISKEVQMEGWTWNTEIDYPLSIDGDGFIYLPNNLAKITFDPQDYPAGQYVQRGTRIYDRVNHTFVFTDTLYAEIVSFLVFTDLPEAARRYITIRAARKFQDATPSAPELHQYQQRDEQEARIALDATELATADYNILNSPGTSSIRRRW